jgi:hypothetical protein
MPTFRELRPANLHRTQLSLTVAVTTFTIYPFLSVDKARFPQKRHSDLVYDMKHFLSNLQPHTTLYTLFTVSYVEYLVRQELACNYASLTVTNDRL